MVISMRKEIIAGLSTFFTAAYLLLLYPKILSEGGIDFDAALTATILTIAASTTFLALYAHFPALLAPGLSVGPFLIYSIIQKEGASWQTALGLVFWAGFVIFLLSLFKVRQKILRHLPHSIRSAAISGIGLFLILVGLKNLSLPLLSIPNSIAAFGLFLFFLLHKLRITASFLITIIACWIVSVPFGYVSWSGLAALPHSLSPTFLQLNLLTSLDFEWLGPLLSVILISLFDTSASITALAKLAHKTSPDGAIKKIDQIVIPDGVGSMFGALLGTGTLAFTLESSSGIKAGGRTGTTALVAAFCTLLVLFFYPLISSLPLFAVTPILIAIGLFMTQEVRSIQWKDPAQSIPSLVILLTIPFTFSIYLGFAYGFLSYTLIKGLKGEMNEIHPICWALALIFAAHLSWAFATHHF